MAGKLYQGTALLPTLQEAMAGASGFTGALGKLGTDINAIDEAARLKARQDELFNMQKAEHQMKVDDVKQKLLEKEQANRYASVLAAATSGNVVGLDDQAKLVAIAQNTKLTPEQQATKIENLLPAMTKAYEKSPEEQLKVIRASNPLGGLADINPATRIALLKEAEAPMEKAVDRAQAVEDRREDAKIAFDNQKKLLQMQETMRETAENRKRALDPMFNPGSGTYAVRGELSGSPLISSADQTVVGTKIAELGKQAEDAGKLGDKTKQAALITQQQEYLSKVLPEMRSAYKNSFIPLEDYMKLAALNTKTKTEYDIFEDPQGDQHYIQKGLDVPKGWDKVGAGSGGTSSGGSKSKKSETNAALEENLVKFYEQSDVYGVGDAKEAKETVTILKAANIPTDLINSELRYATSIGKGWFTDTRFTPENFRKYKVTTADGKTASLADMLSAMAELGVEPTVTDKGLKLDVDYNDLVKTKAYAAQNEVVIDDPYIQTTTTNKPAVVLPKKPTKGLEMGPTLQNKVLNEYDAVVKAYGSGLYDVPAQQAANVVQKLKDIREVLGPTAFEQRYPGVAANYKYFK